MKVLFVNPPNLEEDKLDAETIPLGVLYMKSFIEQKDTFHVEMANLFYERSWKAVERILREKCFDLVGIPCYTRQRKSVFEVARLCKSINPMCKVAIGGPHATFLDRLILERVDAVDFVVRGEGEVTMYELLQHLDSSWNSKYVDVRGVTYRSGKNIYQNVERPFVDDLDTLPFPKHSKEELSVLQDCEALTFHFSKLKKWRGNRIAPILTSRGCAHSCQFCCSSAFWSKQRFRNPHLVFLEIKEIHDKLGATLFDVYDDSFTNSRKHVEKLCEFLIESGLHVRWWCSSRVDAVDENLLRLMKKAGCFMVSYGAESGSAKILSNISKGVTPDDILKTCEATKRAGLFLRVTISIGNPGENRDTVGETVQLLHNINPDQVALYLLKVYPGTSIYHLAKSQEFLDDEYWFAPDSLGGPFYTVENSLELLLTYQKLIYDSFTSNVVRKFDGDSYNLEATLTW